MGLSRVVGSSIPVTTIVLNREIERYPNKHIFYAMLKRRSYSIKCQR